MSGAAMSALLTSARSPEVRRPIATSANTVPSQSKNDTSSARARFYAGSNCFPSRPTAQAPGTMKRSAALDVSAKENALRIVPRLDRSRLP